MWSFYSYSVRNWRSIITATSITYSEVTACTAELAEVRIPIADDDFVQLDLAAIAELDGEIGVLWIIEAASLISQALISCRHNI